MNYKHSISPLKAFPTLVLASANTAALATLSPTIRSMNRVHIVIWMSLWAMCSIIVGVALVTRLDTSSAHSMSSTRSVVSILFGVFMSVWAMSDVAFPAMTVVDLVSSVLSRGAPVQVFEIIVIGIIVAMTRLQPFRPRLNEGFQNQRVDCSLSRLPSSVQRAAGISSANYTTNPQQREHMTSGIANTSSIRHLIIREVLDDAPSFICHKQNVTHGRQQ